MGQNNIIGGNITRPGSSAFQQAAITTKKVEQKLVIIAPFVMIPNGHMVSHTVIRSVTQSYCQSCSHIVGHMVILSVIRSYSRTPSWLLVLQHCCTIFLVLPAVVFIVRFPSIAMDQRCSAVSVAGLGPCPFSTTEPSHVQLPLTHNQQDDLQPMNGTWLPSPLPLTFSKPNHFPPVTQTFFPFFGFVKHINYPPPTPPLIEWEVSMGGRCFCPNSMRGNILKMLLFLFWFLWSFKADPESFPSLPITTQQQQPSLCATDITGSWLVGRYTKTNTHTMHVPNPFEDNDCCCFLGGVRHFATLKIQRQYRLSVGGMGFYRCRSLSRAEGALLCCNRFTLKIKHRVQMELHGITFPGRKCCAWFQKKYDRTRECKKGERMNLLCMQICTYGTVAGDFALNLPLLLPLLASHPHSPTRGVVDRYVSLATSQISLH